MRGPPNKVANAINGQNGKDRTPEERQPEGSGKQTTALVAMLLVCAGLIVAVFIDDIGFSSSETTRPVVRQSNTGAQEEDLSKLAGGDAPPAYSGGPSGGGVRSSTSINREELSTGILIAELKRIARAGKRLEILRRRDNPTLTRRCLDAAGVLKSDLAQVRDLGLNVVLPEHVSLGELLRQITLCASCSDDARDQCVLAEESLDQIRY